MRLLKESLERGLAVGKQDFVIGERYFKIFF